VAKLRLTMACWNYDRARALFDGRVQADGIELNAVNLPVEETFFRMLRHKEFDVAEMSLSSYVLSWFRPDRPFVAIPIFPSRVFRHSGIFVNTAAEIREPKDLIGRKVGMPEYQLTAVVWIRGILAEHYGVPVPSVTYCTGGQEEPGRTEKVPLQLPPDIRVGRIGANDTLSAMLASGAIDAFYGPRAPSSYYSSPEKVQRLFVNFKEVEQQYFRETRIFPIMHTLVIRRDVYERDRWVAQSLYKAWYAAQQETYRDLRETSALQAMLPWLIAHVEETRREMGDDFWPYGLEMNRHTLATFLRYSHAQGLANELLSPEQLFTPETFESFKI
jgi:4,5-dihydroxyphthalate decarboxylase